MPLNLFRNLSTLMTNFERKSLKFGQNLLPLNKITLETKWYRWAIIYANYSVIVGVCDDRFWHLSNIEELTQNFITGMFYSFLNLLHHLNQVTITLSWLVLVHLVKTCYKTQQNWSKCLASHSWPPERSLILSTFTLEEDLHCIKERHIWNWRNFWQLEVGEWGWLDIDPDHTNLRQDWAETKTIMFICSGRHRP